MYSKEEIFLKIMYIKDFIVTQSMLNKFLNLFKYFVLKKIIMLAGIYTSKEQLPIQEDLSQQMICSKYSNALNIDNEIMRVFYWLSFPQEDF